MECETLCKLLRDIYSEWTNAGKVANSIVVIKEPYPIRIALNESNTIIHKNMTDPLNNYISIIANREALYNYFEGETDTEKIYSFNVVFGSNTSSYSAPYCKAFRFPNGEGGAYIPSAGEFHMIGLNWNAVNTCLSTCGGTQLATYHFEST